MQALCQWDVQRDASPPALADFLATQHPPDDVVAYADALVRGFWEHDARFDGLIAAASTRWDVPRMSPVDRNTMRVAVVELDRGDPPPKVVINEAIEIARAYGNADSARFVNGVLDDVWKCMPTERR